MSLYNAICGFHPYTDELLSMIGFKRSDIFRFRDVFLSEHNGEFRIAIFFRKNAGHDGQAAFDETAEKFRSSPFYLKDREDPWDKTFVCFCFSTPATYEQELMDIVSKSADRPSPMSLYFERIADLSDTTKEVPDVGKRIIEVMKSVDDHYIIEMVDSDIDGELCDNPGKKKVVIFPDGKIVVK